MAHHRARATGRVVPCGGAGYRAAMTSGARNPGSDATEAQQLVREVAREFRRRMQGEYVPRMGRCVELLTEPQCWLPPEGQGNSIANLLAHLASNIRQWILVTFAGVPDERERSREFSMRQGPGAPTARELHASLSSTIDAACDAVDRLDAARLLATYPVQQGIYRETGLAIVLHVMEHCSGHAGQVYARARQLANADLKFYDL